MSDFNKQVLIVGIVSFIFAAFLIAIPVLLLKNCENGESQAVREAARNIIAPPIPVKRSPKESNKNCKVVMIYTALGMMPQIQCDD